MIKKLERDARECEKDLIANLKSFWRKHGKTILNYGLVPVSDKATGVGGNTYRAYGGFRGKSEPKPAPSKIFRDWIEKKSNLLAQSPQSIGNSYKRFHRKLLSSLCVHWNAATGLKGSTDKFPKFPHAAKLIDLHIKLESATFSYPTASVAAHCSSGGL